MALRDLRSKMWCMVWLTRSPPASDVHALAQTETAAKEDTISAFAIDAKSGKLRFLNKASSAGGLPNEVIVAPGGKALMVVDFGFTFKDNNVTQNNSAFAALPILGGGKLGEPFYRDHHSGQALSPSQVNGAHTHGIAF